ncbi:MAG: ankyrin repeat domain-containing protein [Rickettsiales bacterium]|jgi:hypothetical protein|nr:ankyrin repeat domain-containing protein [Rickettsiales bacterium]
MTKEKEFIDAVDRADYKAFSRLLPSVNVNSTDKDGYTALHYAARNGNDVLVRKLINATANVNAENSNGYTPLVETIYYMLSEELALSNNKEVVKLLLCNGANLNGIEELHETFTGEDDITALKEVITFIEGVIENNDNQDNNQDSTLSGENISEQQNIDKEDGITEDGSYGSQRSFIPTIDDEENIQDRHINSSIEVTEESSLSSFLLKNLYSWMNQLPEWMQKLIINSTPIKDLIKHAKQTAAIYDMKSIEQDFIEKMFTFFESGNVVDSVEESANNSVNILDFSSTELVDTSLVYPGSLKHVNAFIFPTMIESTSIFDDSYLSELLYAN